MKKVLLIIMMIALIVSTSVFAKGFSDVDETMENYEEAISYLSEKEIISGYPDGSFKPMNSITRAEVIKIIVTSFNIEFKEGTNKSYAFDDITGKWFEDYVKIGASNDIIKGYEDGTFRPNNNVTYAELSAMVCRLLKLNVDEGDDWADAYMNAAKSINLFDNIITNDIVGKNKASRMNVAMILYNALNYNPKEETNSGEVVKPEENNKEEKPKAQEIELVSNKIYFGRVTLEIERSVKDSVEIDVFDEGKVRFDVKDENKKPEYGSLIIFYTKKDGGVKIVKELKQAIINSDDMLVVEAAQGTLAKLLDLENALDISLDEYVLDGNTIKLSKYDYYMIDVILNDNDEYIYDNGKEIKQEDIKFAKDDRIIFDTANKMGFIIRGIEEE